MSTRTLITAEDFETICERLGPCDLVRGEVVEMSPSGFRHSRIAGQVTGLLWSWARQHGCGHVLSGEAGIKVESNPDTVRGADVAYCSYQRLPKGSEPTGFATTPPNLVIEVIGKGQSWRHLVEKAGEYLRMGVDRVWVIDPETRRLHIFRPDAEPTALSEGDELRDEAVLPGFSCKVGQFFES